MGPTQSGRSYSGASSIEGTGAEKPAISAEEIFESPEGQTFYRHAAAQEALARKACWPMTHPKKFEACIGGQAKMNLYQHYIMEAQHTSLRVSIEHGHRAIEQALQELQQELRQVLKGPSSGKDDLLALQSELVAAEYQLAQTQAALADACRRQADTERQQDLLLGTMQAERRQFSQLLAQWQAPQQAPQQASPVRDMVTAAACGSSDLVRAVQAKQAHVDAWRLARTPAVWWAESGTTAPDGSQKAIINPQNNRIHWVSRRGRHRWVAPQEHTGMPQVEHRAADLQQQVASLQQQLQDARELPRKLRRDFQQVMDNALEVEQVLDDALEAEQAEQQRLAEDHRETLRALRSQAASTAEVLMSALDSERQQVATLEAEIERVLEQMGEEQKVANCKVQALNARRQELEDKHAQLGAKLQAAEEMGLYHTCKGPDDKVSHLCPSLQEHRDVVTKYQLKSLSLEAERNSAELIQGHLIKAQDRVRDLEQKLGLGEWYRKRLDSTREQLRVVDLQLAAAVGTSQDALHAAMDVAELEGDVARHPAAPVWSSGACPASKSEDSAEDSGTDMSDLSSDSEELCSEGDIGMAELKELQDQLDVEMTKKERLVDLLRDESTEKQKWQKKLEGLQQEVGDQLAAQKGAYEQRVAQLQQYLKAVQERKVEQLAAQKDAYEQRMAQLQHEMQALQGRKAPEGSAAPDDSQQLASSLYHLGRLIADRAVSPQQLADMFRVSPSAEAGGQDGMAADTGEAAGGSHSPGVSGLSEQPWLGSKQRKVPSPPEVTEAVRKWTPGSPSSGSQDH
eukprot:jgi/Astpho2/4583/Aster-00161